MASKIQEMFNAIASRYDLLNTLLSFGLHKIWKKRIPSFIDEKNIIRILDIATGTGDIALLLKKNFPNNTEITGLDFSPKMIEIARKKASNNNIDIEFIEADATYIPLPNNYFDCVTIAFGIRNIPDINKCLNEIARVLKKDGQLIILEFGKPTKPFLYLYKVYNKIIIPIVGLIFSQNTNAYKYLADTSIQYPTGKDFLEILEKNKNFTSLSYKPQCFGVAYIYSAKLLDNKV